MVIRRIDDAHQLYPWHVEEPRTQYPHACGPISWRRDRVEYGRELCGLSRIEQAVALDERTGKTPRAQCGGNRDALFIAAREHHHVAERERRLLAPALPHRRCAAQLL